MLFFFLIAAQQALLGVHALPHGLEVDVSKRVLPPTSSNTGGIVWQDGKCYDRRTYRELPIAECKRTTIIVAVVIGVIFVFVLALILYKRYKTSHTKSNEPEVDTLAYNSTHTRPLISPNDQEDAPPSYEAAAAMSPTTPASGTFGPPAIHSRAMSTKSSPQIAQAELVNTLGRNSRISVHDEDVNNVGDSHRNAGNSR